MRKGNLFGWIVTLAVAAPPSDAAVFLNEIFINPPGGSDNAREYVEIMGTPHMKLDGYAVAFLSGGQRKIHDAGAIPPDCSANPACVPVIPDFTVCSQEIDEFFALEGLSLGANGMLVLGRGAVASYPNVLADTSFRRWTSPPVWNGGLDTNGGLENDGSRTVVLIRNRPGNTPANCASPPCGDLRWGKDIDLDREVTFLAPPDDACMQWGNGNIDRGDPDGNMGMTLDLKGVLTPAPAGIGDDLELVDEVSHEGDQGWEYDEDDRHVDVGSASVGLPERRVHALDDPQGFNPDCLSRVDYRTKGTGYPPVSGATGEQGNGNNWQDTATEQWIRGESKAASGESPPYHYDNAANTNPDAIQPYMTQVPLWLNDASGSDYSFASDSYEIMSGRINPLAVAYIPGDSDRDGDCDGDDISKTAGVFGDNYWIFSNGFETSPETDSGDPATQTRPWDVDATGDNGIEASDLQWTLNFQGSVNGRIVGVRYDSTTPTPAGGGVALNPNTGVTCAVTATAGSSCGRALTSLFIGDTVEITVKGQVTAGGNLTAGSENGIMQFVHDVTVNTGGVLELVGVQALGSFSKTRTSIEAPQGVDGDLGVKRVNGYATSFTQGLSGTADLYRVTFVAVAAGSTQVSVVAATEAKFAASTPRGLKIGHTRNISPLSNGDPVSTSYPSAIAVTVTSAQLGDVNADSSVNMSDTPFFVNVLIGADTDPDRMERSDLNCDDAANGLDIPYFVDFLLP